MAVVHRPQSRRTIPPQKRPLLKNPRPRSRPHQLLADRHLIKFALVVAAERPNPRKPSLPPVVRRSIKFVPVVVEQQSQRQPNPPLVVRPWIRFALVVPGQPNRLPVGLRWIKFERAVVEQPNQLPAVHL